MLNVQSLYSHKKTETQQYIINPKRFKMNSSKLTHEIVYM